MKIFRDYSFIKQFITSKTVVAIGNFDGLHSGHKMVLEKARKLAKENNLPFIIITFEPHPNAVLREKSNYKRVITLRNKVLKFKEFEPDFVLLQRFNNKFVSMSALNFVREVLVNSLNVLDVVVGYDFQFGHNKKGNVSFLSTQSVFFGFNLRVVPQILNNGVLCSSTMLRQFLSEGQLKEAATALGENYSFISKVKPGNQIGRQIDCRTANLNDMANVALKHGVYLGMANIDSNNNKTPVIVNFGIRPTVANNHKEIMEVHFLNQDLDLYNKYINVELINFVRPEQKFNSLDELKNQISKDIKFANDYFKNYV